MGRLNLTRMRRDEGGVALIEVLVSALVLMIVAAGAFKAFDATTRATAQERYRARANDLAQSDLERIRSLPYACPQTNPSCSFSIVSLITPQSRNVVQDGTTYTIVSRAQFLTETPTTSTCATGPDSRDYLQISTTVSWPSMGGRPPVTAASAVSPPSGSVVPNTGSLLVTVVDSRGAGIPGVGLSGSGPGSYTGTTGPSGCVQWRNLPVGNYTMSIAGVASNKVDQDGNPPQPQTVSVVAQGTNTVNLQYDTPGSISSTNPIRFTTKPYGALPTTPPGASTADSVILGNTGMNMPRQLGTAGTRVSGISASGLFPFSSPYAVYAGTCQGDNPDPDSTGAGGNALQNVLIPIGGTVNGPTIQLPALFLTVLSSTGVPVSGARVRVRDNNCPDWPTGSGTAFRRTIGPTNSLGQLPDPGLPYRPYVAGDTLRQGYEVCADNGSRHVTAANVDVSNLDTGTLLTLQIPSSGSTSQGVCP
jgi:Tfp pilus assembly protein PilV